MNSTDSRYPIDVFVMITQEIEGTIGIFLNIWFIITAIKHKHYKSKRPTFILMFSQSIADTMLLSGVVFYAAPAIALNQFYPSLEVMGPIFGLETTVSWMLIVVNISVLALERTCAVFFPVIYKSFVTKKKMLTYTVFIWSFATVTYVVSKTTDICCPDMMARPEIYTMSHWNPRNRQDNFQFFFDPLNYISTAICLICYPAIIVRRMTMRKKLTNKNHSDKAAKKANREIRLSIQFGIISSVFIFINLAFSCITWFGGYQIFVIGMGYVYVSIGFVNVVIYLTMNQEVAPQMLMIMCGRMIEYCPKAKEAISTTTSGQQQTGQTGLNGPSVRK